MKSCLSSLALLAVLLPAAPAMAGIYGHWRVQGKIAGVAFLLDCDFIPQGAGFGGACTGAPGGDSKFAGKTYQLSQGSVAGDQVKWSYPSHYLFIDFQVAYQGTRAADRITGIVTAAGRTGNFIAAKA